MRAEGLDRAVILARGLGSRMRAPGRGALDAGQQAAAEVGLKVMMPLGRPFLDYSLSALAEAGFRRVCLVIGPEHGAIRTYYRERSVPRLLTLSFAIQEQPRGTADAVLAVESWADGESFAVLNGDNYYPPAALAALRSLAGPGLVAFEPRALVEGGNIEAERLRAFALVRASEEGLLAELVEKPSPEQARDFGRDSFVSMNCWNLSSYIFPACRAIEPSPRGELELPDAVRYSMDEMGLHYRVARSREAVLDLSRRDDIAEVARHLAGVEVGF